MPTTARPPRWRLRPGAPVLRRDAATLQVGLDAPARVLLADTPGVRRLLTALRTGCPTPSPAAGESAPWEQLAAAGLLVPEPAAPVPGGPPAHAATAAWAGAGAAERLHARARLRVYLRGPGARVETLERLLAAGGVGLVDPRRNGEAEADLVVLVHEGEPLREEADPLVAAGVPHLPVWSRAGLPGLGPLVVPGATACLRCVDAHEGEADPRRTLLLEQAAGEPAPPGDAVLVALVLAWVARDVQRYAEGEAPSSWSATVRADPWGAPLVRRWPRHLHCGCAWDVDLSA